MRQNMISAANQQNEMVSEHTYFLFKFNNSSSILCLCVCVIKAIKSFSFVVSVCLHELLSVYNLVQPSPRAGYIAELNNNSNNKTGVKFTIQTEEDNLQ